MGQGTTFIISLEFQDFKVFTLFENCLYTAAPYYVASIFSKGAVPEAPDVLTHPTSWMASGIFFRSTIREETPDEIARDDRRPHSLESLPTGAYLPGKTQAASQLVVTRASCAQSAPLQTGLRVRATTASLLRFR